MSAPAPMKKGFLKIVVVGDSNVGKTSILERYVNKRFSSSYKATIGADFLVRDVNVRDMLVTLQIWDTAGLEKYQSFTASYYRGADACIIVFDKTNPASFASLGAWRDEFLHQGMPKRAESFPFVILGNKCDLTDSEAVTAAAAEAWCAAAGIQCRYFDVSALDNTNISAAFRAVCNMAADRMLTEEPISSPSLSVSLASSAPRARDSASPSCC